MKHGELATAVAAGICISISACGVANTTEADTNSSQVGSAEVGVVQQKMQCGLYTCDRAADATDACGAWGTWPSGNIPYKFGTVADQAGTLAAMRDWERITDGAIHFVPATGSSTHVETINASTCDAMGCAGEGVPYNSCPSAGCISGMDDSNVYHELGHIIGLRHHMERNDRTHYWWHYNWRANECGFTRCGVASADNTVDFGPFDYRSTMMYNPAHPDYVRWDGNPIVPGAVCGAQGPAQNPPGCPGGSFCSTCTTGCNLTQPNGFPTKGDAAAVIELYRPAAWKKFVRTLNESAAPAISPFSYALSSTATIPSTSSPALETWGGNSLGAYVRGSDDSIWKQYYDTSANQWSTWTSLGRPSGSGTVSDPAVVSWAPGRTDVVVRQGSAIYIMSTPTWGTWQSLGGPSPAPASAPAIASWGPNHLDVFVRATDNGIYHKFCTANCSGNSGTWSGWSRLGTGTFRGKPAVTTRDGNKIDAFGHGMDDKIWGAYFDGSQWSGWGTTNSTVLKYDASCPDCSSPAARSETSLGGTVFVRDVNDKLVQIKYNSNHSTWTVSDLGGVLTSSPATISKARTSPDSTFRNDIVVTMAEESTAGTLNYGVWWKMANL